MCFIGRAKKSERMGSGLLTAWAMRPKGNKASRTKRPKIRSSCEGTAPWLNVTYDSRLQEAWVLSVGSFWNARLNTRLRRNAARNGRGGTFHKLAEAEGLTSARFARYFHLPAFQVDEVMDAFDDLWILLAPTYRQGQGDPMHA